MIKLCGPAFLNSKYFSTDFDKISYLGVCIKIISEILFCYIFGICYTDYKQYQGRNKGHGLPKNTQSPLSFTRIKYYFVICMFILMLTYWEEAYTL